MLRIKYLYQAKKPASSPGGGTKKPSEARRALRAAGRGAAIVGAGIAGVVLGVPISGLNKKPSKSDTEKVKETESNFLDDNNKNDEAVEKKEKKTKDKEPPDRSLIDKISDKYKLSKEDKKQIEKMSDGDYAALLAIVMKNNWKPIRGMPLMIVVTGIINKPRPEEEKQKESVAEKKEKPAQTAKEEPPKPAPVATASADIPSNTLEVNMKPPEPNKDDQLISKIGADQESAEQQTESQPQSPSPEPQDSDDEEQTHTSAL